MKIKTQDNELQAKVQDKRYFHISTDKLADAFEKQFLKGLPDFGQYSINDQQLSPESLRNRRIKLGLLDEQKRNSSADVNSFNHQDVSTAFSNKRTPSRDPSNNIFGQA